MAGLHTPLSTLHVRPHDRPRMTRGRCGSLLLHRNGLAPSALCRSPGAPDSGRSSGRQQPARLDPQLPLMTTPADGRGGWKRTFVPDFLSGLTLGDTEFAGVGCMRLTTV